MKDEYLTREKYRIKEELKSIEKAELFIDKVKNNIKMFKRNMSYVQTVIVFTFRRLKIARYTHGHRDCWAYDGEYQVTKYLDQRDLCALWNKIDDIVREATK